MSERTTKQELPPPRLRKHPHLWQAYLYWDELVELRKRHTLRISAAEREVSNLDAQWERDVLEHMSMDGLIKNAKKMMVQYGKAVGPVWEWGTSIRGLGEGGLLAQIIAQVDDIARFDTVSKLWRFAGYAVLDGAVERNQPGEKSHYNRRLKSICFLIADQFVRQQTPVYAEMYYAEKERQRRIHPETVCVTCGCVWDDCPSKKSHKRMFNDGHVHNRALRKVVKIFLQHLWVTWRESEELPVTLPYAHTILGHSHYVEPPAITVEASA